MNASLLESGGGQSVASSTDGTTSCSSSHSWQCKALVLAMICALTFGSYFSYDNPGALGDEFKENLAMNSTAKQLMLYSVYSWPNVVQPFVGGYIIDTFLGVRGGSLLCSVLVSLGVLVVAFASTLSGGDVNDSLPFVLALLGRLVFGLGGECLTVTQNVFCSKWFRNTGSMAMAFAVVLSFSRVGSAVNFAVERPVSVAFGFSAALWLSFALTVLSVLACVALAMLDVRGERQGAVQPATTGEDASLRHLLAVMRPEPVLIYCICVLFYSGTFTFIAIALQFFSVKYGSDKGYLASLPYTVSACVSPLLGLTLDAVGYSLSWVCLASLSLFGVHVSLAVTNLPPVVAMVWLGLTYSLCAAALWPMLAFVVPDRLLDGMMTALQNLGLAIVPLVVGELIPSQGATVDDYVVVEWLFAGFAAGATLCCIALFFVDRAKGGVLNAGPAAIAAHNRDSARRTRGEASENRSGNSRRLCGVVSEGGESDSYGTAEASPFLLKTPEMLRRQFYRKLEVMRRSMAGRG